MRSSIIGIPSVGTPSSNLPFAEPVDKNTHTGEKSNLITDTYRYPRGKLLEIYRKQRLVPSFSDVPEGMEEVTSITESYLNEPLAFIAPDVEEGAVLSNILKGKLANSGSICNPSKDTIINENVKGIVHWNYFQFEFDLVTHNRTLLFESLIGLHLA
ncbi:hypothetical protein AQUCO_04000130v1 [Aquilegia coerulea]|uniref:Uncharacterized protein n=1 Tax=Aquilegia coerulea TaxID=218851 RepID=A0A2G5CRD7_AQUCA|nr:hypothetical protein AQUCO_04000130v1 [Aquilegia coerulea]